MTAATEGTRTARRGGLVPRQRGRRGEAESRPVLSGVAAYEAAVAAGAATVPVSLARAEEALARLTARISEAVVLGRLVLTVLAATVIARLGLGDVAVDLPVLAASAFGAAVAAGLLGLVEGRGADAGGGGPRWTGSAAAGLLLLDLLCEMGVVAAGGGLDGPFWLLLLPLVLVAAMTLPALTAVVVGMLASAAVVGGAALAGTLDAGSVAHAVVVVPVLPAAALFVALISGGARRTGQAARVEHQRLERDLGQLTAHLERVAAGDLVQGPTLPADANPSSQAVTVAFADTQLALRRLVTGIAAGSDQIRGAAADLLQAATAQATAAEEQSAALLETTSTVQELASTAGQIAENAAAVSGFAAQTLGLADTGREAVHASVESMDTIEASVGQIAARALRLGERSQEIGRILGVIDDLADQTNLLALNAAIEAARAGEHGRGFAVVASEVRKLAERSQESAGQIQAIVAEIQAETSSTIIASEEGAKEVRAGTRLARGVVDALERIIEMVDETTTAAKEISIATQQQRSASDQVVTAMRESSTMSRSHAAVAASSARSAAELDALAAELDESVHRFRLPGQS